MDAIRENDDEPDKNEDDDSLLDESPPAEKELFTHNNLINQNIEYNYSLCYSEYPTIFDSLPSKVDDLEDESYLWEKQLVINIYCCICHVDLYINLNNNIFLYIYVLCI